MAATGSSNGYCKSHDEPLFEECMQLLMGHSTSQSRRLFEECKQLLKGHSTSRSRRLTPSALGLQLLVVRGKYLKKKFAKLLEELVWLRWYDFPHGKLPSWLSTGKLRVLELNQAKRLTKLWGPCDAPPSQLRELIINMSDSCNLQMIPETIGFLKHLKKIVLKSPTGRTEIEISSLPEEFCHLESLEHLELPKFSNLSSLPTDFGNLRKLKYIDLCGCKTLMALPVSFNQLTELQYLDLSGCENLQLEKDILKNITKLEKLRFGGCFKLQQLPTEITRQMYLRELCLSPTGLRELPADIDRLAKLEVLQIGGPCLTSLPTSLGNLSSLIKLEINDCCELKCFPSLGNLSCLIKLRIDGCRELMHLPSVGYLTRLENLELISIGVEYLPEGFGQLVNLQILNITKVPTVSISEGCCPSLEDLKLSENDELMEIETLPTTLKSVHIFGCQKLKNIRVVAGLAELQELKIRKCPRLDKLPSFAGLVELQRLMIEGCPQLDELPSFECCICLKKLNIGVSNRVRKIEGLEESRSLTKLQIRAESRSAIETCVSPNIVKRPCRMDIVGRAVKDVESVAGSLRFPNFTVVNKPHRRGKFYWEMKAPLWNARCVIACFVIYCRFPVCYIDCNWGVEDHRPSILTLPLEGKQVYLSVCSEGFHLNDDMEASERVFLTLHPGHRIEIEKVMAVKMRKGEEEKASEVLHNFLKKST